MRWPLALAYLVFAPACFFVSEDAFHTELPDGGLPPGKGVGATCERDFDCRQGLSCAPEGRTCQPVGRSLPGARCTLSAECLPGNHCSPVGLCAPSGQGMEGASCTAEGDCASGLVCNLTGLYGTCAPAGTGDLNAACMQTSDCRGGLLCAAGRCQNLLTLAPWEGARCPDEGETAAPKVHFRVPRAGAASEDFYALPFPNDVRRRDGKVSLAGHPRPGARVLPFDPVERYLDAIAEDATGFGLNPTVFFRFSRNPAFGSLERPGAIAFYDLTAGPTFGTTLAYSWHATTGRGRYICPRFVVLRHGFGSPLRPGATYAVVLSRTITDDSGVPMGADEDFKAMLAASMPAEPDLAAAWQAYAPLRALVAQKNLDPDSLAAAAVFTTEPAEDVPSGLRRAVRAAAAPEVKGMIRCGDPGVTSPCAGGGASRACPATPDPAFDEYHGRLAIPFFQKGTPPFEQPMDGGGIERDGAGLPRVQRIEEVCFSLAVPRGTAPAAGWPVVVYAHGTGGHYRSHVGAGLAAELARGEVDGGGRIPMAMLGYDGVLHGPRRGGSTRPPDELVYNFLNPRAARDNALQAAADLYAIARALEGFSAAGVRLDPAKVGLWGHSQGGNAAAIAAAYEPLFGAVVLSGTGGTLTFTFLHKTRPVNVPAVLPTVLSDPVVDANHPVLALMQMFFDRADPVNHARRLFFDPPAGVRPKHVLHVYGLADTYSPVETQRTLAQAAALPIAAPALDRYGLPEAMGPFKGNLAVGGGVAVTAVQAQYRPMGYDGHFVSTEDAGARRAVRQMLGTYARDGVPAVAP